jgi:cytochrome c553
MTIIRIASGVGLLLGLASGQTQALEGDAERGQQAAGVCVACHQVDGMGMNNPGGESWPRLAGLPAAYIEKQLNDIKAGRRESAAMMPFANMLDDQHDGLAGTAHGVSTRRSRGRRRVAGQSR